MQVLDTYEGRPVEVVLTGIERSASDFFEGMLDEGATIEAALNATRSKFDDLGLDPMFYEWLG